jgi:ABC-type multidrug transport system fused ATPase/permease subunit
VLLDEPTASLDTQSETLIQEALQKFTINKTVIVVAHRLSTIKDADKILVLNGDRIEECGSHVELMKKDGLYKKLYLNQSTSEKEQKVC